MSRLGLIFAAASVAAALGSGTATAAITTYNDRAAFTAATGVNAIETFGLDEAFPIPGGVLNSSTGGCCEVGVINPGMILPGVTYFTNIDTTGIMSIDTGGGFTGGFLITRGGKSGLTVTFDGAQSAFGFDTDDLMDSFFVAIFAGETQLFVDSYQSFDYGFYGYQSSSANITSVIISTADLDAINFAIDNFTFRSPPGGAIPEPSSWAMLLTGFGAMGVAMRRRRALTA
jgi:hypothetical protein